MTKREPGLDLLRCIALLFVVTFHSFLYNGYYFESQTGIAMWLAGSLRWLSVSCIGLFLMLTGYLKSEKTDVKACYRGLVPVLMGYFIAAAISIPIRHFIFGDVQTFSTWLTRLFSFNAVYYGWYVEMYIGLVLLCPFINIVLLHLQRRKALLIFGLVMVVITALSGATPWVLFPDYWRSLYPYILHLGSHCTPDSAKDQSLAWYRSSLNDVCHVGCCNSTFDRWSAKRRSDMGVPGSVDRVDSCVPFCGAVPGQNSICH